jgi:structural maintenance of chromosome 4
LENFKSYAGQQNIGPFHKCLSAVVGPNGSGKSNVIDAMLFVFGKRAKQLRLKKVGELIHKSSSGSGNQRSYEYARVDVFFRQIVDTGPGDEDYIVVPNSEAVVSRIAHRDNSSKYQINNKTVQFKDVATYLESHGIDLDNNRFLILQGEVEMISMMPPIGRNGNDDGLLEYLEDIIGSQKFVPATTTAAEQVEKLSEVRLEKLHRVQTVEREKESLVSAKVEAESLLSKDRMIRHQQNILYQMYQLEATTEVQTLRDQQNVTANQLQTERTKYANETARIDLLEQSYEMEKKQYDVIHQELVQTKEEFNAYERRDIKLREQVKHTQHRTKQLTKKVTDLTEKIATSQTKVDEATANIPQLEQEIVRLTNLSSTQDGALQVLQEQVRATTVGLRTQLETAARSLLPLAQTRNISTARYETVAAQIDLLQQAPLQAQTAHEQAVSELNGLAAVEQEKRHQLVTTKQALVTATARLDTITRTDGPHAARDETQLVDRRTREMVRGPIGVSWQTNSLADRYHYSPYHDSISHNFVWICFLLKI